MAHDGALAGLCMPPRALLTGLLCVALALVAEESSSTGSFSLTALQSTRRATNAETLQRRGFAGGAPEPNVAWLMSGSVRTLPLPFVYKSIKHNAIDAFGGRSYVLGYLKTEESPDLMFIGGRMRIVHSKTCVLRTKRAFSHSFPLLSCGR